MAPPRKRPKPAPKSVEQLAQEKKGTTQRRRRVEPRETALTKLVARQQQIVIDRDVHWMTWTTIAAKHKITERTARRNYQEYVTGIAPLLTNEIPREVGHELVRKLQGIEQQIAAMVGATTNDLVKLGALNSLARVLGQEIELRQHLGLLPKRLGDIHLISDQLWAAEQIIVVLRELKAPAEAYDRVSEILTGAASN
jgi:hypothetical protein